MAVADQIERARRVPEAVRVHLPPGSGVARGGIVAHLHGPRLRDRPGELVDRPLMLAVTSVRPQADGKMPPHLPHIRFPRGGQHRRRFVEGGVERRFDVGPVKRFEQVTAEDQRHQFGGREDQRRGAVIAVHEAPARLPVDVIGDQRKAGLQGL